MGNQNAWPEMTQSELTASSALTLAFQDMDDARADFQQAELKDAAHVLNRLVAVFDSEPLASFLSEALPAVDFDDWLQRAEATAGSFVGSAELPWPHDRTERASMQVALCRYIAAKKVDFLNFVHNHFHVGSSLSAHVFVFQSKILVPLLRDIRRLSELRQVPSDLAQAIGRVPLSGDTTLDNLLQLACERFRDPAPSARNDAIEKLWDGWERLKTLAGGNKGESAQAMLDSAALTGGRFRELLETEARALTKIGNEFHIRHFETDKTPLRPAEVDYLFHRMFALINLILSARSRSESDESFSMPADFMQAGRSDTPPQEREAF